MPFSRAGVIQVIAVEAIEAEVRVRVIGDQPAPGPIVGGSLLEIPLTLKNIAQFAMIIIRPAGVLIEKKSVSFGQLPGIICCQLFSPPLLGQGDCPFQENGRGTFLPPLLFPKLERFPISPGCFLFPVELREKPTDPLPGPRPTAGLEAGEEGTILCQGFFQLAPTFEETGDPDPGSYPSVLGQLRRPLEFGQGRVLFPFPLQESGDLDLKRTPVNPRPGLRLPVEGDRPRDLSP